MSIYDSIGKRGDNDYPDFVKLQPQQRFRGVVQKIRTHRFMGDDDDTIIYDCIAVDGCTMHDPGERASMACRSVGLHNRMVERQPVEGDTIDVFRGPDAGRAHTWTVDVIRAGEGAAPVPAPVPAPTPAPAPVATNLA